jgi:hypothetical protein
MAYMQADTSAKVGFRPYHQTDPFGASHLSGVSSSSTRPSGRTYFMNRPFDTWQLYPDVHATAQFAGEPGMSGLGQNHPFKPQAWHLQGLGDSGDPTSQAVAELQSHGAITPGEAEAILEGSMSFTDVLGYDPTEQSSWLSLGDLFREVNSDLKSIEAALQAAVVPGQGNAALSQLAAQTVQDRQQYNTLATQYVQYYTLLIGSAPAGLSGLGFAPIVYWAAGAAVFIVTAFVVLYAIRTRSKAVDVQSLTAQSSAATNAALTAALQKAQASGDTITAQSILNTLKTTAASSSPMTQLESWITGNAMYLGLGLAGLAVLPNLFGGGKRRR